MSGIVNIAIFQGLFGECVGSAEVKIMLERKLDKAF